MQPRALQAGRGQGAECFYAFVNKKKLPFTEQFIDKEITYWNREAILYETTEYERVCVSDTGGSPRGVIIGIHTAVHTNLTLLYVPQSE